MSRDTLRLTPKGVLFQGRLYPVRIGKNGLSTDKHEGDGATPVGTHHIVGMLWRADRLAQPAPWARPIGPGDLWCDDPSSDHYNQPARAPFTPSHEKLRRADPLYDIVLLTDWNYPHAEAAKGSAIFLHQRRGPAAPTAGCIAFRRQDLIHIAQRLRLGTKIVVPDLACFRQCPRAL